MSVALKPPKGAAGRIRARLRGRQEAYVFCPNDRFSFRPLYTGGKCPLCGEAVTNGSQSLPLLVRFDRFKFGMTLLALVSVGMSTLVLVTYFTH